MSKERIVVFHANEVLTGVLSNIERDNEPQVDIVCIDKDADDYKNNQEYYDYLLLHGYHETETDDISWRYIIKTLETIESVDNMDHINVVLTDDRELEMIVVSDMNCDYKFFYTDREKANQILAEYPDLEEQVLTILN